MIKRYFASKDNVISNAFEENLTTRATGSNMGASHIVEVFSIYGQASSGSSELARTLIQFDTSTISTDRDNGDIPASGSVSFYLKLYDAPHSQTTPRDFKLVVSAVSSSWEEGYGLDMDNYQDLTKDNIGSNWMNANGDIAAASLVDAIDITGHANGDKFTMTVPTSAGGDGVTYTFLLDSTTNVNNDTGANTFGISRQIPSDDAATAVAIVNAINGVANAAVKYGNADTGAGSTLAAGTIGLTAAIGSSTSKITLTMDTLGVAGNASGVLAAVVGFENDLLLESSFTGGDGHWATVGGDYHAVPKFEQSFDDGFEDLEIDVSHIVEEWIASTPTKQNYGFGIQLSSSYEAYYSASSGENTGSILHNIEGAQKSYFRKKFYGRETEFHFKRPTLEARWDDSRRDDRGNFYYSSSLAPANDNLNTLYFYNYVRGRLRNIPSIGSGDILVSLYTSSVPGGIDNALTLYDGNKRITGSHVSTGIYKCDIAVEGTAETLYDVWHTSSIDFLTGAITPKTLLGGQETENAKYVLSMPNLSEQYRVGETPKLRLYARQKNWSPNIYTIANAASIPSLLVESGSYQIKRAVDDEIVIPYGTGSLYHTGLSYDVSGNYFKLDTGMLEAGYQYEIYYAFFSEDSNSYVEQPYKFKFRVSEE